MTTKLHDITIRYLKNVLNKFVLESSNQDPKAEAKYSQRVTNILEGDLEFHYRLLSEVSNGNSLNHETSIGIYFSTNDKAIYIALPSKTASNQPKLVQDLENKISGILETGRVYCGECPSEEKRFSEGIAYYNSRGTALFNTEVMEIGNGYLGFKITPKNQTEMRFVAKSLANLIEDLQPQELEKNKIRVQVNGIPYEFMEAWKNSKKD